MKAIICELLCALYSFVISLKSYYEELHKYSSYSLSPKVPVTYVSPSYSRFHKDTSFKTVYKKTFNLSFFYLGPFVLKIRTISRKVKQTTLKSLIFGSDEKAQKPTVST